MKVEIHDLKHEKWFVEAEPSLTIGQLKEQNAAERALDAASLQKMIYSGKILKDTDTLESIGYSEGKGFIVCMVSKSRKPAAKPAPPKAKSTTDSSEAGSNPEQPNTNASSSEAPSAESSAVSSNISGPSAFARGHMLQTVITNIMDLGFSQKQVMRALTKAYNNPDRAVEYLISGQVPEIEAEDPSSRSADSEQNRLQDGEQPVAAAATQNGIPEEDALGEGNQEDTESIDRNLFEAAEQREMEEEEIETGEDIDFHELLGLDEEQLSELRAAVRQNPQNLLALLDPLVRSNPQIAETLINNLDQFIWFLQAPGGELEIPGTAEATEASADGQTRQIAITTEEEAAIFRLMELGFEYDTVALAFLACEKDEQLTANYLLEHGHED